MNRIWRLKCLGDNSVALVLLGKTEKFLSDRKKGFNHEQVHGEALRCEVAHPIRVKRTGYRLKLFLYHQMRRISRSVQKVFPF